MKLKKEIAGGLKSLNQELGSVSPEQVVVAANNLDTRERFFRKLTIAGSAPHERSYALVYAVLRNLENDHRKRITLARMLVGDSPAGLRIDQVVSSASQLQVAGEMFSRPVDGKLAELANAEINFWDPWNPEVASIKRTKKIADDLMADESLPEAFRVKVKQKYDLAAVDAAKVLQEAAKVDRNVFHSYGLDRSLDDTWLPAKKALRSVSGDQGILDAFDNTVSEVVLGDKANILGQIRENPHGVVYHKGLVKLATLLETPEKVAKMFTDLGFKKEDLRVLFALSIGDPKASGFLRIASACGFLDKEEYRGLVEGILNQVVEQKQKPINYRGKEVTLYRCMIRVPSVLAAVVEVMEQLEMPTKDNPLLAKAIETEVARLREESFEQLAVELQQYAKEQGIVVN